MVKAERRSIEFCNAALASALCRTPTALVLYTTLCIGLYPSYVRLFVAHNAAPKGLIERARVEATTELNLFNGIRRRKPGGVSEPCDWEVVGVQTGNCVLSMCSIAFGEETLSKTK